MCYGSNWNSSGYNQECGNSEPTAGHFDLFSLCTLVLLPIYLVYSSYSSVSIYWTFFSIEGVGSSETLLQRLRNNIILTSVELNNLKIDNFYLCVPFMMNQLYYSSCFHSNPSWIYNNLSYNSMRLYVYIKYCLMMYIVSQQMPSSVQTRACNREAS